MKSVLVGALTLILAASSVAAASHSELRRRGFVELWSGDATLRTCMDRRDHAVLGRYVFSCGVRPQGAVFGSGPARLMARLRGEGSGARLDAFLCFEGRGTCVEGALDRIH